MVSSLIDLWICGKKYHHPFISLPCLLQTQFAADE